jgi:hypothetical protein
MPQITGWTEKKDMDREKGRLDIFSILSGKSGEGVDRIVS